MTAPDQVRTVVVRAIEPIDMQEFLLRYARAIVEARGAAPSSSTGPQLVRQTASTSAA